MEVHPCRPKAPKHLYPNSSQKDLQEWFEVEYNHSLSSGLISESDILSSKYNHLDDNDVPPSQLSSFLDRKKRNRDSLLYSAGMQMALIS